MSEQDVKNPPKARKQQFVRLYPKQEAILARWRAKYATPISEPDLSTLIRLCIDLSERHIDQEPTTPCTDLRSVTTLSRTAGP